VILHIQSSQNSSAAGTDLGMQAMLEFQVQTLSAPGEPIWALRYILSEIAIYTRYLGISPIQGVRAKYPQPQQSLCPLGIVSCRVVPLSDRPTTTFALAWPTHQAQATPASSFPSRWKSPEAGLWSIVCTARLGWPGILSPPYCPLVGLFTTIEYDVPYWRTDKVSYHQHWILPKDCLFFLLDNVSTNVWIIDA
jgi:hypothetical protein